LKTVLPERHSTTLPAILAQALLLATSAVSAATRIARRFV